MERPKANSDIMMTRPRRTTAKIMTKPRSVPTVLAVSTRITILIELILFLLFPASFSAPIPPANRTTTRITPISTNLRGAGGNGEPCRIARWRITHISANLKGVQGPPLTIRFSSRLLGSSLQTRRKEQAASAKFPNKLHRELKGYFLHTMIIIP